MKKLKVLALVVGMSTGLAATTGAVAFENGLLGSTSTGNFEIRYLKNPQVQINQLQDVEFATDAVINAFVNTTACLHSTSARASIQLSSGNTGTPFSLSNAASNLAYQVSITGDTLQDIAATPSAGTSNGFVSQTVTWDNSNQNSGTGIIWEADNAVDCTTSGSNLAITTTLTGDPTGPGVIDGKYTDTVTLLVAPL